MNESKPVLDEKIARALVEDFIEKKGDHGLLVFNDGETVYELTVVSKHKSIAPMSGSYITIPRAGTRCSRCGGTGREPVK